MKHTLLLLLASAGLACAQEINSEFLFYRQLDLEIQIKKQHEELQAIREQLDKRDSEVFRLIIRI